MLEADSDESGTIDFPEFLSFIMAKVWNSRFLKMDIC